MKKIYLSLLAATLCCSLASAQTLYNNGGTIYINTNGKVHVRGHLTNGTGATLNNNGTLEVTGNSINNGTLSAPAGSEIVYEGTAPLIIGGSQPVVGQNVTINNAAGVTLNTPLQVSGVLSFTNGIIDASGFPLVLSHTATVVGASDESHVKGDVVKEGTGAFTYPVGDGSKYQKVTVNASANATGIKVRYYAANAGAGTFSTGGTQAMPLEKYNAGEYWEVSPNSTATAAITLFWDGYKDAEATPMAARRVAHFIGGDWVNEGGSATGTIVTGSITSNAVSTFSPFALGGVSTTLPVKLTGFTAKAEGKRAKLAWTTASELNNSHFIIARSAEGKDFIQVAKVNGNGTVTGINHYTAYDYQQIGRAHV